MGVNWDKGIVKGRVIPILGSVCTPTEQVDGALLLFFAFGPKVRGSLSVLPLVLTGLYRQDIATTDKLYCTLWSLLVGTLADAMPNLLRHYQLWGTIKSIGNLSGR